MDIVYKNNTFYVYNTITIQSTFNSFDDNQLKSLEELKNGLGTLLGKDSQIIIDKNTGTFVIKAKPNALRENMDFVENMINSRSRTALLKLYVYKINNSKLNEKALNIDTFINDVITVSSGTTAMTNTPALSMLLNHSKTDLGKVNGKNIQLSMTGAFKMLENQGIIHNMTNTQVNLYNAKDSILEKTKEVGDWIPGETQAQNTVVNGVTQTTYNEGKPTFEKDKVGLKMKFNSRVDMKTGVASVNVDFSDSSIYGKESTEWQRSEDSAVTLSKNLKDESIYSTRLTMKDGEFKILSGLKQDNFSSKNAYNQFAKALGNSNEGAESSDIFIVAKALFPSKKETVIIKKKPVLNF